MYGDVVSKQRDFFKSGTTLDVGFRREQLKLLRHMIEKNESKILEALRADLGKSDMEGYLTEVGFVLNELDYMIKKLDSFVRPRSVRTPIAYLGSKSYIMPEPYGVVLILSPWNYPFQLTIAPLIGAMAAGNCAILKPSEHSYYTTELLAELILNTFDEEYVKVIEGEIPETQALLEEKFDYIFFTGSIGVGKVVMEAAARYLTPITLELGGKSPCIVDKNVDIKLAAKRIAWGKFLNAGQTCVAPDYILIHREIKQEFLKELERNIYKFYGEDPKRNEHFAHIINKRHFDRLASLLEGGDIVIGGEIDGDKLYIEPTILENIDLQSRLMQDEIFGPLLPVIEYENIEETVSFIENKPKPLALYLFTQDQGKIDYILKNTSSGGVCINDTISHMTTKWLPFGGVGTSGMGKYHGKASFDTFSHEKSVLEGGFRFDLKQKYPPYSMPLEKIKKFMKFL